MAAELPRPGVEVIQEFAAASPTVLQPTLVPFVTGPAKEVIEVTDADGLVNEDALQGDYEQLPQVIAQNAFPSPRGNIQEVNVEEATIQTHLLFGGSLSQLDRDPGSAFLTAHNEARRAVIRTKEISGAGIAIQGLTIVLALDVRSRLNTTEDVTVTFASVGGGDLTAQQVADQINAAVGEDVATLIENGPANRVQIASQIYGAASSVTLRAGGSGNTLLGAASDAVEYRVEGAGFHAQDQANNTTLSPYIVWSQGLYLEDGVSNTFPAAPATTELSFGQIKQNLDGTTVFANAVAPDIAFTGPGSIDLRVGDYFVADGARPNSTAEVSRVEANRFKLGVVNASLSTFDEDGNVLTAVYDDSNLTILLGSVPFAPQWAWFRARNIDEDNPAATAATLLGSIQGNPAEVGSITSSGATGPFALAGLTLVTVVTDDGVEQDPNVFTFTGGPFATMADVVSAIGSNIPGVVPSDDGGELVLSTAKTGKDQAIQLTSASTALTALSLTAGTGTGKDVEFVDVAAAITGGTQTFPFNETSGETLVIEGSDDGGDTWTAFTRTFTFSTTGSAYADIATLLAALNTAADWDGGTLPTEFTISNSGDAIVITSAATGSDAGIRIGAASTALGATTDSDLLFSGGDSDVGEENINGQIFKLRLNDRPQIYTVVLTSDSLNDAVEEINEVIGWPIAEIGGSLEDQLQLTSTLEGAASRIEVIDDGTNNLALSAFGFAGANDDASGSGRPNADFFLDGFGQVNLGAEVLRNSVTGEPFGPGTAEIYIQYTGLRLDLSPQAAAPALLSISDVETLQTVLNPITSANPLGLAMFFQLINAPGIVSKGMGISATSAAAPEGTAVAYAEVTNFLESEEVYAMAPLTQDQTIFDIFRTHVDFMSGAEQKGERILIQSPPNPTRAVNTVVASGLSAQSTATQNELVLDVNPTSALVSAGIDPSQTIPVDDDLYIQLTVATGSGQEVRNYSVQTVNSTLVVFRTTFAEGENEDAFYSITPLTETIVNADWSMQIRGAPLLLPGSTLPDKDAIAETVAALNSGIGNRRVFSVFPDTVKASLSGTEELLPSYYAAAAMTGMIASQPPQQGFTNLPMTGFTGVQGSSDTFSVRQLNVMAGGGTYVLIQDAEGTPVISRHQLSTNVGSIETRELSITKVVDFVAKFMRTGLRNFIGTFNITQPFLDTLSTVIQGMLSFLEEAGTILGGDLNNLIQDTSQPDTVLVDITLDVPFPCNFIRLTLVI